MDLSVRAGSIRRGNLATLGPSPKDDPFYGTPKELGQIVPIPGVISQAQQLDDPAPTRSDVGSKRRHPRSPAFLAGCGGEKRVRIARQKRPRLKGQAGSEKDPAATYSPARFPAQYHRLWRA
jgi:hypothetical protein